MKTKEVEALSAADVVQQPNQISENISEDVGGEVTDGQSGNVPKDEGGEPENGVGENTDGSSQSADGSSEPEHEGAVKATNESSVASPSIIDKVKETAELMRVKSLIQKRKLQDWVYFGMTKKAQIKVAVLIEPDLKDEIIVYLESEIESLQEKDVVFVTTEEEASSIIGPMIVFSPLGKFAGWPLVTTQREDLLEVLNGLLVVTRHAKGKESQLLDQDQVIPEAAETSTGENTQPEQTPHNELGEPIDVQGYGMTEAKRGMSAGIETLKGFWSRKKKEVGPSETEQPKAEAES